MRILLLLAVLFPITAWARSCTPWQMRVVYPPPVQRRTVHRPHRPHRPRPVQHKIQHRQEAEAEAFPSWWSIPRDPRAPMFISGSATKPEVNEYEKWKQMQELKSPHPRRKAIDSRRKAIEEGRATRKFLLDVLEDETE